VVQDFGDDIRRVSQMKLETLVEHSAPLAGSAVGFELSAQSQKGVGVHVIKELGVASHNEVFGKLASQDSLSILDSSVGISKLTCPHDRLQLRD